MFPREYITRYMREPVVALSFAQARVRKWEPLAIRNDCANFIDFFPGVLYSLEYFSRAIVSRPFERKIAVYVCAFSQRVCYANVDYIILGDLHL